MNILKARTDEISFVSDNNVDVIRMYRKIFCYYHFFNIELIKNSLRIILKTVNDYDFF